ncbi:MAG TPA: phosphoribosylamine--glycine ligase [Spirochaetota bacterium]|nr:phosphoribosylamine--glycine ligase [Spirochaetota bacterium]
MKVMVVGQGGREHALCWKLAQSYRVEKIFCTPGNGGTAGTPKCKNYPLDSLEEQVQLAVDNEVDLAVIGPEGPLVMGIADILREAGIPTVGPGKSAAALEGSKAFAKDFMMRYGVKTSDYRRFHKSQLQEALQYLEAIEYPVVVKADGLAAGKGVTVHKTKAEAHAQLHALFVDEVLGESGHIVLVEKFIWGREVSVIVLLDGTQVLPLISAMDYKRIGENDTGLNTGGMGAISPNPFYTEMYRKKFEEWILNPTIKGLQSENIDYRGVLYFGLMMTEEDVYLLEYNVRFGDPETQAIIPMLEEDLAPLLHDLALGQLHEAPLRCYDGAACSVVVASRGYPGEYRSGIPIQIDLPIAASIFVAGAQERDEESGARRLYTSGGRVLSVTGVDRDLTSACRQAYTALENIYFEGRYYRRDIGKV